MPSIICDLGRSGAACILHPMSLKVSEQTLNSMPHEVIFGEIYLPPLLLVSALAYALTSTIALIGSKFGLYKHFAVPAIVDLSLMIILMVVISHFIPVL